MNKRMNVILIAGSVLLAAGTFYRFSPNIKDLFLFEDEIAIKEKQLRKYMIAAAEGKKLDDEEKNLSKALDRLENGLLNGDTGALAAVDIQNLLTDIAGKSEVEITSMRVLEILRPDGKPGKKSDLKSGRKREEQKDYFKVPVQVSMRSTIRQLKDALYEIETSRKILNIQNISIKIFNKRTPEILNTTLTLVGLMKSR